MYIAYSIYIYVCMGKRYLYQKFNDKCTAQRLAVPLLLICDPESSPSESAEEAPPRQTPDYPQSIGHGPEWGLEMGE